MRIRQDSPFYGISEQDKEHLMHRAELGQTHDDIAEQWEQESGKETNSVQVTRFLRRLRYERAIHDTDAASEEIAAFAPQALDGKARDGVIEAARQKLFEEALAEGDSKLLLELYRAANEERARERELEVSKRKAAAAEENAKIGWRRLEWEQAKSAVKLLPKIREALMDGNGTADDRVARMREILLVGGGRLLGAGEKGDM